MSIGQPRAHEVAVEVADRLEAAKRERSPVEPISQLYPEMTAEDAYRIQRLLVLRRVDDGDRVVGYKVGLTSRAMQELLGVDEPDYAPILSSMVLQDGAEVRRDSMIQPKAEAEIAFILAEPLLGPGIGAEDVRLATQAVAPAIEIIDSRIRDWAITLVDTIADMASSAGVVLGEPVPLEGFEARLTGVVLERNGTVVATGAGAAALGDPALAVAWAVNTLGALGETIEPGHVIMPGALHAAEPAEAGDSFTAHFDRIGAVKVRFS